MILCRHHKFIRVEWVYRTEKVIILKEINHKENFVYTVHTMPFPFQKRDSIVHSTIEQDPESLSVMIRGKATPGYLPEKKVLFVFEQLSLSGVLSRSTMEMLG
jgi:hypothetical protein